MTTVGIAHNFHSSFILMAQRVDIASLFLQSPRIWARSINWRVAWQRIKVFPSKQTPKLQPSFSINFNSFNLKWLTSPMQIKFIWHYSKRREKQMQNNNINFHFLNQHWAVLTYFSYAKHELSSRLVFFFQRGWAWGGDWDELGHSWKDVLR